MIVGTGIDVAEVPRVAAAIERFGQRFIRRIFTEGEIRYCDSKANRIERYAARFAAKEAGMKALGTGWNHGVRWRDVEVVRHPGHRPTIVFHGKAADFARYLDVIQASLSITHTNDQAIAQVILENYETYREQDNPDPYHMKVVGFALRMRTGGMGVVQSASQRALGRLGDAFSVALLKLLPESKLVDAAAVAEYLPIMRDAFATPGAISTDADKDPRVSLFLLQSFLGDPALSGLRREIQHTIDYVRAQTSHIDPKS